MFLISISGSLRRWNTPGKLLFMMEYVLSPYIPALCAWQCLSDYLVSVFQDTVSVHRPSFYADRFLKFMGSTVFRKLHRKTPHDTPTWPLNLSSVFRPVFLFLQRCVEPLRRGRRARSTPASRPRRRLSLHPRRRRGRRRKPWAWNSWTLTVSTKRHISCHDDVEGDSREVHNFIENLLFCSCSLFPHTAEIRFLWHRPRWRRWAGQQVKKIDR